MTSDTTTAQWKPAERGAPTDDHHDVLVLLASVHLPHRVGEVAFLPSDRTTTVLGRKGTLRWLQHRPGTRKPTGPLDDPMLSRSQLEFTSEGGVPQAVNVGRLPLLLNGRPVDRCPLRPGDLLEIGDRVMLLVTRRPEDLPGEVASDHPFGAADAIGWVGEGPEAWRVREEVEFVARRTAHVLVLGESGTGKELVANGLHRLSPTRSGARFISRNAATIPESLADAELFGNLAGYPNPGMPARPGLIGEADRSTLFLDEFGELPEEVQARLLRVLDSGEYTRLGEARQRRADVRLLAATNRDPSALKHDVLARLKIRIEVPPLSTRVEDLPLIATHLLRRIAREDAELATRFFPEGDVTGWPHVSLRLVKQLVVHRYTTHVRELEAILWQSIQAARGNLLDAVGRPGVEVRPTTPRAVSGPVDPGSLDPELVQAVLDRHGGAQEPVWRELGLASRHVLARFVKKHGLEVRRRG